MSQIDVTIQALQLQASILKAMVQVEAGETPIEAGLREWVERMVNRAKNGQFATESGSGSSAQDDSSKGENPDPEGNLQAPRPIPDSKSAKKAGSEKEEKGGTGEISAEDNKAMEDKIKSPDTKKMISDMVKDFGDKVSASVKEGMEKTNVDDVLKEKGANILEKGSNFIKNRAEDVKKNVDNHKKEYAIGASFAVGAAVAAAAVAITPAAPIYAVLAVGEAMLGNPVGAAVTMGIGKVGYGAIAKVGQKQIGNKATNLAAQSAAWLGGVVSMCVIKNATRAAIDPIDKSIKTAAAEKLKSGYEEAKASTTEKADEKAVAKRDAAMKKTMSALEVGEDEEREELPVSKELEEGQKQPKV